MKKYSKIVLASILMVSALAVKAQPQGEYNENVTVNVSFDPMITDANKINENPSIFDTSFTSVDFSFDRLKRGYKTNLTFDTIKAASVKGEPVAQLYKLHLKGGLGYAHGGKELSSGFIPLLQASYTSLRDRKLMYGVDLYSRSAIAGQKNYGHNGLTNDDLNLWVKRIFNSYSVYARGYYNLSRNYWYGDTALANESIDKKDYRATWHNFGLDLGYKKLERDNTFQHNADFSINYTSSKLGAHELDLHALLNAYKDLNLFSKASNEILGLTFDYKHSFYKFKGISDWDYTNQSLVIPFPSKEYTNNRALFNIAPYFIFDYNKFHFFASLGFVPSINGEESFQALPTATVSFELIQQILSFYGGIKSESVMPTLHQMLLENPFLAPNLKLKDESNTTFFAKAFLNASNKFSLSLEGGMQSLRNHHFYLSAMMPWNNMIVIYDNAKRYYATLESGFSIANAFFANISATYQKLDRDAAKEPWYNPNWIVKAKMTYKYQDLFEIALTPAFYSKCTGAFMSYAPGADINKVSTTLKEKELKPIVDVNLSATYHYTDRWSFFINLENMGFQQYQMYYNYPVYQFSVIGGACYKF